MDKYLFTEMLCEAYSKTPYYVVKRKHGRVPQISFEELCHSIYEQETVLSICEHFGGISHKTLKPALVKAFPDIAEVKDRSTVWRVELLLKLGYRRCNECNQEKILDEFYNAEKVKAGKSYTCKICAQEVNRIQRIEKPQIIKASNRKRKAIVRGALASDANLDLIKNIYKECPEGYHVDHIIPISKGGLHHETNLCYLPAKLNMQKQAKMPEEVPEIMKYAIYPDLNT